MVAIRTMTWDEPKAISDVLKAEFSSEYCREVVTIASGAGVLDIGTVLGKVTASGKWKAHTNGASDGTETAAAVLLQKVDATSADQQAVVIVRGPAVLSRLGLIWDSSVDNNAKKDAAIAQLVELGLVARDSA